MTMEDNFGDITHDEDSNTVDCGGSAKDQAMLNLLNSATMKASQGNGTGDEQEKSEEERKDAASELEEDVPMTFPQRLMEILSNEKHADVITWLPHGKGFIIYKKKKFAAEVLPIYFKQSKFTSFTRKLNRWGFTRVTRGPETGAYYHKFFQRGDLPLCMQMSCQSTKSQRAPLPNVGGLGGFGNALGNNFPLQGNPVDIAQQNQSLIRHQLQQLQFQQLQLQQLQMQQQQQLQAAELMRQALAKQQGGEVESTPSSNTEQTKADPSALFLQTLQRTKESGTGLMGTQPIALLPSLQNLNGPPSAMGDLTRPPAGNGRAWAA